MTQQEFEHWKAITDSSVDHWVEDNITRLNGNGGLYYTGGEDGHYMRLSPDGKLTVGTYEGAYPHIGEACFTPKAAHQYGDINEAFEVACQLGGKDFLLDILMQRGEPDIPAPEETSGPSMDMTM